jgi:hypothetical protein
MNGRAERLPVQWRGPRWRPLVEAVAAWLLLVWFVGLLLHEGGPGWWDLGAFVGALAGLVALVSGRESESGGVESIGGR